MYSLYIHVRMFTAKHIHTYTQNLLTPLLLLFWGAISS